MGVQAFAAAARLVNEDVMLPSFRLLILAVGQSPFLTVEDFANQLLSATDRTAMRNVALFQKRQLNEFLKREISLEAADTKRKALVNVIVEYLSPM